MENVRVELGSRSYDIWIGEGMLAGLGSEVAALGASPRTAVISNPTVFGLYGETVMSSLRAAGFDASEVIIPDGESYKDFLWAYHILGELLRLGLDRSSVVVALGGGVIGDIAGFAASTYMRGIGFVQVPTTLLAQVDSSVGGKTGVNHRLGKNMIGTFWQPRLVWADTATLRTLERREFLAGVAEVIKYGVIWDEELFAYLEKNVDAILQLRTDAISHIVRRSCEIKAEVVSNDEREAGLRAILNFGHTIGHAIETVSGYGKYLHGEAVAIGMCIESELSEGLGVLGKGGTDRLRSLTEAFGLPVTMKEAASSADLLNSMMLDKKAVSGKLTFILPERIGAVRIAKDVKRETVMSALGG